MSTLTPVSWKSGGVEHSEVFAVGFIVPHTIPTAAIVHGNGSDSYNTASGGTPLSW